MPTAEHHPTTLSLGATDRRDNWFTTPIITALIFIGFIVYATWAALVNAHYEVGPYLSPFYSPLIHPSWLPSWFSPAIFILWIPGGFRATCYYYRKAYYRAFFFDPWGCSVGEGRGKGYNGERAFPFVLQNLHRFFLYLSIAVVAVLWYDAFKAFVWEVPGGGHRFGMGIGTLVLVVNALLLSGYTFGCHSLRHLVGGKIDAFSCTQFGEERHGIWKAVSWLNKRHHVFAWASLFSVALADLYVRLLSMGVIKFDRLF
jgi:hypothetical protein